MIRKIFFIILTAIILCGCTSTDKENLSLVKVDDENIGALCIDDNNIYYASYDMNKDAIFPKDSFLKKISTNKNSTSETFYSFDTPLNISYINKFGNKFVIVADDLEKDILYILDNNELKEIYKSEIGNINPSYSGDFLTWVDVNNNKVFMLDNKSDEIKELGVNNLFMHKYERPYNFNKETYVFTKMSDSDAVDISKINWKESKIEEVLNSIYDAHNNPKNEFIKPTDIEVNDSFIIWKENSRKSSKILVHDIKNNETSSYDNKKIFGFVKASVLLNDKVFLFDEVGDYGIEYIDLKNKNVKDLSQILKTDDLTSFSPVYPYISKKGFISRAYVENKGNYFIVMEGK